MGLFSSKAPEPVTPAISRERITAIFDKEGWNYHIDNEGDLGGMWDDNNFHFMLRGNDKEILMILGRWHDNLPIEKLEQLREFITTWHRTKLWPKCYHRIDDEGKIRVFTEVAIDHEHGANDDQLAQHIHCALATSNQFFKALVEEVDA
ncbi:YbjN domain-containing protein [Schaalia suimastitidis]|uniref:YbjN domain-containing protein n=1 Tax=Schaalia suimastitidis TaxID=121163 RepID=UPI0003FB29CF|nr:YbjN domain-containing protein [Schaalia suimastitidis]